MLVGYKKRKLENVECEIVLKGTFQWKNKVKNVKRSKVDENS